MEPIEEKWQKRIERERTARREAERLLEEKSRELFRANASLERQARDLETVVAERTRRLAANQEGLVELNRVLLGLGYNFDENITKLTRACGEILRADAVLFSVMGDSELKAVGRWVASSKVEVGSIEPSDLCRMIASRGPEQGLCVQENPEQESLAFYVGAGYPVVFHGEVRGVLTVFYSSPAVLDPFREQILEMIATAIGSEQYRERTQKELAEKERRFSEVFERSMDGIIIHDTNGKILEVNRTAADLFGRERSAVIGMTLPDLHPREWLPVCRESMQKVAKSGSHRFEAEFLRKDDSKFLAEISASSFEVGGQELIQGIIRDITEKRRLEDEREKDAFELARAKEEAERANAAKSVFLANLSHEIRTPLNGIIGFAKVLAGTGLEKSQKGYLDTIRASGEVLLHIINDTLDLSRIEHGRTELNAELYLPAACVSDAIEILTAKADEEGLKLSANIGDGVPEWIRGDANRVRQILLNLINNALKFTNEGGVTVRLAVESEAPDSGLLFEISDTGVGISTAEQERLFEPFTQFGEGAESREGAGLGLAICHSLVEAMGGTIGCESEPDKGSRFWFTVPSTAVDALPGVTETLRIAVAVKNQINRQLLAALAERAGHTVEEMENLEAVEDDSVEGYDFIVADSVEISRLMEIGTIGPKALARLIALVDDSASEFPWLEENRKIHPPVDPRQFADALKDPIG